MLTRPRLTRCSRRSRSRRAREVHLRDDRAAEGFADNPEPLPAVRSASIPANLIADHLQFIARKEKVTLETAAAHAIAKGADGGLRDAESMLDQLVAFCGEPSRKRMCLNVFGFTSEQTVARFTEQILQGNTAEALELLHSEADNGKDMMKLMSDLIAYLRDLLVFQVKPDAVADEFNPELQHALQTQAALIETDRLLELIDQFAGAEAG
jgi:DNA polymerase-3 subunit gamma/tau